jgi:hypothetical protein
MDAPLVIRNWDEVFEKFNTRDRLRSLDWVSFPTAQDGHAFSVLSRTTDGVFIFGVFVLLVQMSGRLYRHRRGEVADELGPMTAERFSDRFGLPIDDVKRAFTTLSSKNIRLIATADDAKDSMYEAQNSDAHRMRTECDSDAKREKQREAKNKEEQQPGFARFWLAWPKSPRKVNRKGCFRIWVRENLEPLADAIIADVNRQRMSTQWFKNNGEFIPLPATYLNQSRWEADSGQATGKRAMGVD